MIYHSAFDNRGFSKAFRDRYKILSGDPKPPEAWPQDCVRIDNRTSMKVIEDIGVENCGKGLTVAVIPRRALCALKILDTDGAEYPDLDPDRFVVHHIQQLFVSGRDSVTQRDLTGLIMESKTLHLRIISRAHLSPEATTANRYACLSV